LDFLPLAWEALMRFSELIGLLRPQYGVWMRALFFRF